MSAKNSSQSLTIFTPSLQRTGSEIVLLHLLPYLGKKYKITVVTKYKGELYKKLPSHIIKKYLFKKPTTKSIYNRAVHKLIRLLYIPYLLNRQKNTYWYINTIMMPEILSFAQHHNIPTSIHIHELEHMYANFPSYHIQNIINYPSFIIANSQTSAAYLKSLNCSVPIHIIYPAIPTKLIKADEKKKAAYRHKLQIFQECFVWVMAGTLDSNKNPLLFIEIARVLQYLSPLPFKMMWIGGSPMGQSETDKYIRLAQAKGINDILIWTGDLKEEYYNYFNCADGFVLTSQFESFSLATVEAMLLGLPVVAQDCGGVKEILTDKYGILVEEKNNAQKMAEEMVLVMNKAKKQNTELLKLQAQNFDIEIWGKKWAKIITRFLNNEIHLPV